MNQVNKMEFAQRLLLFRKTHGMTQEQLACKINYTIRCVQSWETGSRLPCYDALAALAQLFHVSADYLLCLDLAQTRRANP